MFQQAFRDDIEKIVGFRIDFYYATPAVTDREKNSIFVTFEQGIQERLVNSTFKFEVPFKIHYIGYKKLSKFGYMYGRYSIALEEGKKFNGRFEFDSYEYPVLVENEYIDSYTAGIWFYETPFNEIKEFVNKLQVIFRGEL